MKDLLLDDADELNLEYRSGCGFKNFFRMKTNDFEGLLNKIAHIIQKPDTPFKSAIPPHERLAVTLRFLPMGDSFHSLSYTFKISKQIISAIIPIVCEAIVGVLQDYIKVRKNSLLQVKLLFGRHMSQVYYNKTFSITNETFTQLKCILSLLQQKMNKSLTQI